MATLRTFEAANNELPDPPYPSDTRAKGWRFELEYERIEQSDTWSLASEVPMAQHALLMMWMVAWSLEPCGSLPNDEAIIRIKCKLPAAMWSKSRDVLMRGWTLATDGRLYHETITKRVLSMLEKRASDAQRAAARRERNACAAVISAGVTQESRVTPPGVNHESTRSPTRIRHQAPSTKHQEPSTRDQAPEGQEKEPPTRKREDANPVPEDVDPAVWRDWLALRKAKRAPVTETVIASARCEAQAAGMTLEAFLRVWCARGSQGLQAEWLRPHERTSNAKPPAVDTAARNAEAKRMLGFDTREVIDV